MGAFALFCTSCQSGSFSSAAPLRVGITPDYPPMIFLQDGAAVGIEADMARRLADELRRPLKFVEVPWDKQIDYLLRGETDIIMSGMSITRARRVRIDFTKPYFKNALMTLMRRSDASRYQSVESITQSRVDIGVQAGTTGDTFVRENCPNARRIALKTQKDAPFELKRRRIDLFIHDGPAIAWLVSENESDLTGFWLPLTEEYLAWGVRRNDVALRDEADRILAAWKKDGTLRNLLSYWLPYLN